MSAKQDSYKVAREAVAALQAMLADGGSIGRGVDVSGQMYIFIRGMVRVAPRLHAAFAAAVLEEARALLAEDREAAIAEAMDFVRWAAENQEVQP